MSTQPAPSTVTIMKEFLRQMKAAEPELFQSLIEAFDVYSIEIMQGLTQAPQDQILNMQGRAQQCQAFLRLMQECHIQKKPPAQPQAPTPGDHWTAP